jgi:S1-C subfamily serine protease
MVLMSLGRIPEVVERLRAAAALGYGLLPADTWQTLAGYEWNLGDLAACRRVALGAVEALGAAAEALGLREYARSAAAVERVAPDLPRLPALVVTAVAPGSAGEAAGLREGDAILAIDGGDIESANGASDAFRGLLVVPPAGARRSADLRVRREGAILDVAVPRPAEGVQAVSYAGPARVLLSVTGRTPGGAAERAGVLSGDVLWSIGGVAPESLHHAGSLLPKDGEAPKRVVFRRFKGSVERGARLRRDASGAPLRDEAGRVSWESEDIAFDAAPGELLGIHAVPFFFAEPSWR